MSAATPGQQLTEILTAAARVVVERRFPGQDVDAAAFVRANRTQLLTAISGNSQLRAALRTAHPNAAESHELFAALLGKDRGAAVVAAEKLGADRAALAPRKPKRSRHAGTPAPAPPSDSVHTAEPARDRRASNAEKVLAKTRKILERDRGRLTWAEDERDDARRERDATINDRDEALAVIESLRAELAVARARETALAGDVHAAARLLIATLAPAQHAAVEVDVREQDRGDFGGGTDTLVLPSADVAAPSQPGPVLTAVTGAGLSTKVFLAVLDAIANPPAPVPEYIPTAFTRDREMSLTPLGGSMDIGGSCMLVEVGDVRILIDAGNRPKPANNDIGPPDIAVATAGHIDAVVLTHAHNDHSGYVPVLTSRYPNLPVYCTADTAALLPTMWNDSVKVFERTRHERAAYGDPAAEPPYTQAEATAAQYRIHELPYKRTVEIADGVTIELFPAGHILGAASVIIAAGASRVTVTGDVSDLAQASVPGLVVPESARHSDLLVIESTYCRPGGKPRAQEIERFVATVTETVKTGRVLVPAFALGRAQEVVLTLRDRLPDVPILVDGMAKEISRIYETQTAGTDRPLEIYGNNVKEVLPASRREQNIALRRGVIVTTSGMLSAGPAIQWARWILPDPNSALLVSGYQDEESPGRALLDLARGEGSTFSLDGQDIEVRANVADFKLSAHASREGLRSIIGDIAPAATMLVHGVASAQREFADHLHRHGFSTVRTERWQS